jgi:hypothetical protein
VLRRGRECMKGKKSTGRYVRQRPPAKLKMSMRPPWGGVLAVCPAVATTEVEDVDAGPVGVLAACLTVATIEVEDVTAAPPGECWRHVRQGPPPKLKTSMTGPWGVLAVGSAEPTTEAGDVDGSPQGGAGNRSGSGDHRS